MRSLRLPRFGDALSWGLQKSWGLLLFYGGFGGVSHNSERTLRDIHLPGLPLGNQLAGLIAWSLGLHCVHYAVKNLLELLTAL